MYLRIFVPQGMPTNVPDVSISFEEGLNSRIKLAGVLRRTLGALSFTLT